MIGNDIKYEYLKFEPFDFPEIIDYMNDIILF